MGFNTVALFLNDRAHDIAKSVSILPRLKTAMSSGMCDDRGNGMHVLPSQHADCLQIVAAGGNTIRHIGFASRLDDDEAILRKLADQHGFRLVRKSQRLRKEGV